MFVGKNLRALCSLFLGCVSRQLYGNGRPNHLAWSSASSYGMVAHSDICRALRGRALCSNLNPTSQVKPMAPGQGPWGRFACILELVSRQFYGDGRPNREAWSAANSYGMVARSGICIALRERALCSKFDPTSQASGDGPEYAPVTFALRISESRKYRTCCG